MALFEAKGEINPELMYDSKAIVSSSKCTDNLNRNLNSGHRFVHATEVLRMSRRRTAKLKASDSYLHGYH